MCEIKGALWFNIHFLFIIFKKKKLYVQHERHLFVRPYVPLMLLKDLIRYLRNYVIYHCACLTCHAGHSFVLKNNQ